jgi:hypothetical protein
MKSKLLIGALVAAFALSATTDVVFAAKAKAHHAAKHKAMMMNMTDANKVPNCGKGKVPVWHMMGKAHWTCSKPA